MRTILLVGALISCASESILQAQTLQASVIGAQGGHYVGSNGHATWTIGEIVTETVSTATGVLTQGFHQPYLVKVTGIDGNETTLAFYPNPVSDLLHIDVPHAGDYQFELIDLFGRKVLNESFTANEESLTYHFDLSPIPTAMYLVHIRCVATTEDFIFKIEKN
jgi:hypothetical protein